MSAEPAPATPPTADVPGSLLFLVVDDDRTNRLILASLLKRQGHRVIEADDGERAVELFGQASPDAVLMDVMMPVMDGLEAARRIKAQCGGRFVPVIFLTALNDEQSLKRCLNAGGDDFLAKPFSHAVLEAKISALLRTRALYAALERSHAEILTHHQRLQQEQTVAERLFRKIVHRGCLNAPNIKYLISPAALFNGDLLLAARRPAGGLRLLLGDFAGHGLPAAVGAIPIAEIFYVMTAKGYSIGEVVAEINLKLKSILPTGHFLGAVFVDLDRDARTLAVWNGGIPDVLVRAPDGELVHFSSQHLPLGVVGNEALDAGVEMMELAPGSRIVLYTDGAIEARNAAGQAFGQAQLERLVAADAEPFRALSEALAAHGINHSPDDDVTLVEITAGMMAMESADPPAAGAGQRPASEWRVVLELGADALRTVDPLPACLQMAMELQGLHAHRERLYLILAELFSNALEHGLLRLDSTLKHTPQGFAEYYERRERALDALGAGTIRVTLSHRPEAQGGRLSVSVEDSGPGFAAASETHSLNDNLATSGRGLALVRSLCREVTFRNRGASVEAVYEWRP